MYVQILWQGQKTVLTIEEFEFFWYQFQLLSTFSTYAVNFVLKIGFFAVTWAANE